MLARFSEALLILWHHIRLFAAIILTVWLPGNILANYIAYNVKGASDIGVLKLTMLIEGVFGPIYIGALVFALFQIKSGRTVTYKAAMTVGLKKWGALFVARLMASLYIVLGLIAVVIPGIVLAVRYSLLDAAVIIEDKWPSESRARSTNLTTGRRWQIFWSGVLVFVTFIILSLAIYAPLGFIESLNTMIVEVILDCLLDIAYAVIHVVIFLFYWESIQEEKSAEPATGATGLPPSVNA